MIPAHLIYTEPEADPGPSEREERDEALRLYGDEARAAYVTDRLASADWHRETAKLAWLVSYQARVQQAICTDGAGLQAALDAYRAAVIEFAADEARIDPHDEVREMALGLWREGDE